MGKKEVFQSQLTDQKDTKREQYLLFFLIIPPTILAAITALFYSRSINYSFQFDDIANIRRVFGIRHATFRSCFFSGPRWISSWLNAVNYRQGFFEPFYYRLFNISFHILTGILVFYLVFLLLSCIKEKPFFYRYRFLIAYATSALFLLHPVQTQTVSYVIQGRLEGLATLSVVILCLLFVAFAKAPSLLMRVCSAFLMFIVGILSCGTKEISILSPFILLLIDWFFIAKGDLQKIKSRLFVHAMMFMLIVSIYLYFLKPSFFIKLFGLNLEARNNIGNLLTEKPGQKILPLHFMISQFKVLLHYMFMFLWPFNISVEYDWKLVTHFFAPDCIIPLLILVSIGGLIFHLLKRDKTDVVSFCFIWFFLTNLPRSSIIPSSELLTDYKTYLPSIGLLWAAGIGIVFIITRVKSLVANQSFQYLALTSIACVAGIFTYQRNLVWRSNEEFWSNIILNAPGKARAYNNLGVALSEKGKIQEAIPLYKKAIQMDNSYPDPINNLAVSYSALGKTNLAIEAMKQGIKIQPNYPEGYNNLASFYIMNKKYDEADKLLDIALKLRPHYGKAFFNKGKLNIEKGNYEKALQYFRDACTKGDLDNETGFKVYANAAGVLKKWDEAIFAYQKLLAMNPHSIENTERLAQVYFNAGNYSESLSTYKSLVRLNPNKATSYVDIAECYAKMNSSAQALEYYRKALQMDHSLTMVEPRIAACLEKIGMKGEAKAILDHYAKNKANNMELARLAHQNGELNKKAT